MKNSSAVTQTDHNFRKNDKLLIAREFQFVFEDAKRVGNSAFTLLARENVRKHARLGLAISKKCAKRAVDRNVIKRLIRESFRLNHARLPNVDIVVMCKPAAIRLNKKEMRRQIDQQWDFIQKKFAVNHDKFDHPFSSRN